MKNDKEDVLVGCVEQLSSNFANSFSNCEQCEEAESCTASTRILAVEHRERVVLQQIPSKPNVTVQ